MAFCTNCGYQLADGAKFCFECGAKVDGVYSAQSEQRKAVYDGEIHKCPNCGGLLDAFVTACPLCGYEIRGAQNTYSVQLLASKLQEIETSRESVKPRKTNLSPPVLTKTDEQKLNLIKSFPIPNTKEDLIEFLMLADANIEAKVYDTYMVTLPGDPRREISDAWRVKFDHAFSKAMLVLRDSPELKLVEEMHARKEKEIARMKRKLPLYLSLFFGTCILIIIICSILAR